MILSRYTLKNISPAIAEVPGDDIFELPEKVLQFGTGVLLRGLPDYFIDKANKQQIFNGRIVVVKSTSSGDSSLFEKQDGLYTVCVRGMQNGETSEENIINASISRVLNAQEDWKQILQCAHDKDMQIIISNTTEVGIQLIKDDIHHNPPKSYPGKLLSFLYERYHAFEGSKESGMVIIPTELITDNGAVLESIVLELAHLNGLEEAFIEWLENCNHFCNSLVDRIVPGKPDTNVIDVLQKQLGYKDDLLIMTEMYRLWAIEGDEKIKNILSFAEADDGVVIEQDIDLYRELKLRLLNGTHTLSCGLAFLSGCETVKDAMDDEVMSAYISDLMRNELVSSIPYDIDKSAATEFAYKVLDRFRNASIKHHWINISAQYSSKMKLRCVPMLLKHYKTNECPPQLFALGFAAYIYFLKPVKFCDNKFYGVLNGKEYIITDDRADIFFKIWQDGSAEKVVKKVLEDEDLWGYDLYSLPGFYKCVLQNLNLIIDKGAKAAIELVHSKKELFKYE